MGNIENMLEQDAAFDSHRLLSLYNDTYMAVWAWLKQDGHFKGKWPRRLLDKQNTAGLMHYNKPCGVSIRITWQIR